MRFNRTWLTPHETIWSLILRPICPPQWSGWCRLILGLAVNNYLSNNTQVSGADKMIAPDWVGSFPILNCKYQPCLIFTGGRPDRDFRGRAQILVTGKQYWSVDTVWKVLLIQANRRFVTCFCCIYWRQQLFVIVNDMISVFPMIFCY